jgi:glucose-6-phosphate 1-dehydrogenase
MRTAAQPDAAERATAADDQPAQRVSPCVMVIFGAAGDLTKRKLMPALYNLAAGGLLPRDFAVVGLARPEMSSDGFRERIRREIRDFVSGELQADVWERLERHLYYVPGEFADAMTYQRLQALLTQVDHDHGTEGNYFYYLATAPLFFAEIVRQIGAAGLTREDAGHWRRVIIEKPFGRDLESARALNGEIGRTLRERQIYRIDHYLGKETVQNILAFRFSNGIFEPIWNRRYIDHVQITAAETVGVEQRGGYYEQSGALRDMVPNHLFQLLSLTAMEPPISFAADAVRDEQAKTLHAIPPLSPDEVATRAVRGQYGQGTVNGQRVAGYRAEPNVAEDSTTETFAGLKLFIDNWRWADVPFYMRTGKRLPARLSEIAIQFKRAPFRLFRHTPVDQLTPNRLVLHLQPDEGISLSFGAKVPGPLMRLDAVNMDFKYADYFGTTPSTGYERLLHDCMIGDATLFQRADMVEAGWQVVTSVLDVWQAQPPRTFPNYPAGTSGPREIDELLERDGRQCRAIGS